MKAEYQKKLFENHPEVFNFHNNDPASPTCFSMFGIECGDGWYDILDKLLNSIKWHQKDAKNYNSNYENVQITQIKEKFGTLRFYYFGGDDYISGLVQMAESMSGVMCEDCGNRGTQTDNGWIRTLCKVHSKLESNE
jgi:hypothetical protein